MHPMCTFVGALVSLGVARALSELAKYWRHALKCGAPRHEEQERNDRYVIVHASADS